MKINRHGSILALDGTTLIDLDHVSAISLRHMTDYNNDRRLLMIVDGQTVNIDNVNLDEFNKVCEHWMLGDVDRLKQEFEVWPAAQSKSSSEKQDE